MNIKVFKLIQDIKARECYGDSFYVTICEMNNL